MVSTAFVKIWGLRAGAVAWDDSTGTGSFEFEPSFLKTGPDLSPLMMPLAESEGRIWTFPELRRSEVFKGLPGLLADAVQNWSKYAKETGVAGNLEKAVRQTLLKA